MFHCPVDDWSRSQEQFVVSTSQTKTSSSPQRLHTLHLPPPCLVRFQNRALFNFDCRRCLQSLLYFHPVSAVRMPTALSNRTATMLSFLQNQLGRRASALRSDNKGGAVATSLQTRSSSALDASSGSSEAPSLTPPTSLTDAASLIEDAPTKTHSTGRSSERLRHVRSSIGSYGESVLPGTGKHRPRRKTVDGVSRMISGETLVEGTSEVQHQLVQESVQALNEDWTLGALPGDDLKASPMKEPNLRRRKSTRLEVIEKATSMAEKTANVLGKRGRETADTGLGKLKGLKGDKRSSLRPRDADVPAFEGPVTKKARFSDVTGEKRVSSPTTAEQKRSKPPTKRWLSQGLYVGQERDFDPRLTESKNQLKRKRQSSDQQHSVLPLPMFTGARTLENGRHFKLPFDVFSPLPPGQPRPDEWRKTHKSRAATVDQYSTMLTLWCQMSS